MGKRKRSKDRDYHKLIKKIKKLEEKANRHRGRRITSSSSDSEASVEAGTSEIPNNGNDLEPEEYTNSEIPLDETRPQPQQVSPNGPQLQNGPQDGPQFQQGPQDESEPGFEDEYSLDPDILEILGTDPSLERAFSDIIHRDIATRWKHILLSGLQKDQKTELLRNYLPAENCPNMQAPKLNLEIKAALSEINYKKDLYNQGKQRHLSSCLSAVGKALNMALAHTEPSMRAIIKPMSDAGRMLCDLHYRESQSRRYAIINTLNKQTRDIIKNTKIDEQLFGSDLGEHLKSSRAVVRSGNELRQSYFNSQQRPIQPTMAPTRSALNARGQPRPTATVAEPRARQAGPRPRGPPPPPLPPPPPPRDWRPRPRESTAPRPNYYNHYRNQRTRR